MGTFDEDELSDLRWHWRGAYAVNGSDECWVATRTDTGETLFSTSAEDLRGRIRDDYAARPVPRPPMRRSASPDVVSIMRKHGG